MSRTEILAAWRRPEPECVPPLVEAARVTAAEASRIRAVATKLVVGLRAKRNKGSGVDALMKEFSLSSQEGVALMCMAEALLRIPDADNVDRLIRDKLARGDWRSHLGSSPSLFVNAATWGLLITGKLVATSSDEGLSTALARLVARGGEPLIRKAMDLAMRLLGEQFVTGQTIAEALQRARHFEARGYCYSFDMLGEEVMRKKNRKIAARPATTSRIACWLSAATITTVVGTMIRPRKARMPATMSRRLARRPTRSATCKPTCTPSTPSARPTAGAGSTRARASP